MPGLTARTPASTRAQKRHARNGEQLCATASRRPEAPYAEPDKLLDVALQLEALYGGELAAAAALLVGLALLVNHLAPQLPGEGSWGPKAGGGCFGWLKLGIVFGRPGPSPGLALPASLLTRQLPGEG